MESAEKQNNDSEWLLQSDDEQPTNIIGNTAEYSVDAGDSQYTVREEKTGGYSVISVRSNGALMSAGTFSEPTDPNSQKKVAEIGESYVSEVFDELGYSGPISFVEEKTDMDIEEEVQSQDLSQFEVEEIDGLSAESDYDHDQNQLDGSFDFDEFTEG